MRKLLSLAMTVLVLGVGLASGGESKQPGTDPTAQIQAAELEKDGPPKDCPSPKEAKRRAKTAKKQAKQARKHTREEADPDTVEYGGGG